MNFRKGSYIRAEKYKEAKNDFELLLKSAPNDEMHHFQFAQFLVTCPAKQYRDYPQSLKLVEKGLKIKNIQKLPDNKKEYYFIIIAEVYAQNGDFPNAVLYQKNYLKIIDNRIKYFEDRKNESTTDAKKQHFKKMIDTYHENKKNGESKLKQYQKKKIKR